MNVQNKVVFVTMSVIKNNKNRNADGVAREGTSPLVVMPF